MDDDLAKKYPFEHYSNSLNLFVKLMAFRISITLHERQIINLNNRTYVCSRHVKGTEASIRLSNSVGNSLE